MINITLNELSNLINNHLKNNKKLSSFPFNNYYLKNTNDYIKFKENDYSRNTIFRNDIFEIIAISWWGGSKTNYHKHPENGCKLKVIFGKLKETLLLSNKIKKINLLKKNNCSYLDNSIGIHQIEALEPSLSIHIYSPPGYYDK